MSSKSVISFCRKNIGRAVALDFVDNDDNNWRHFRIERVLGNKIAISGMTDDNGNQHDGDYFWVKGKEIKRICLRN